ncbi:hypothetical protein HHK36_015365 [Tetracentron sinense]|uniref:Uncharacterized protein n=1 Tax=Tetracentron sinense TaxID=13715 RepID=A0A835DGP6_TETSI|nr:hypothetical protein HHK36_015365 [Tetracentron sinense]
MSFSVSPQPTEMETNQFIDEHGAFVKNTGTSTDDEPAKTSGDTKTEEQTEGMDSNLEGDLSIDDLVKLVTEEGELLMIKHKEIEKMTDKVLHSYAEMMLQNFAKSLLDVEDYLGRDSSVVKDSFSKIDVSKDTTGAMPLLKTLLKVFRKSRIENFDPMNEQFDPHRHYVVFEIPDGSKPPSTVVAIRKSGYMLYG